MSDTQTMRCENALGDDVAQQSTCIHSSESTVEQNSSNASENDGNVPSDDYFVHSQNDDDEKSKQFKTE